MPLMGFEPMTCRTESGVTYKQTYNAENRIASIQKLASGTCAAPVLAAKWDFTYDGDGVRTGQSYTPYTDGQPGTVEITRYYFGGAYETRADGSVRKYYAFAGQTVAQRTCTEGDCSLPTADWTLTYFLTDHLGSVSMVLSDKDENGNVEILEQQRYLPFGGVRTDLPGPDYRITGTDFTYTGQRDLPDTGLMDYKARFYSPYITHFSQPDTIVSNLYNPQSLNRYSYVLNNPIKYNDPTGHKACEGAGRGGKCDQAKADDLLKYLGITTKGLTEKKKWALADAASAADKKLKAANYGSFRYIHGDITVNGVGLSRNDCETNVSTIECGSDAQYMTAFLHEFGHVADNHLASIFGRSAHDLESYKDSEEHPIDDGGGYWMRTTYGFQCDGWDCLEHPPSLDSNQTNGYAKVEQWADLYMNWVLDGTGDPNHGFTNDSYGNARRKNMAQQFYWIFTGEQMP